MRGGSQYEYEDDFARLYTIFINLCPIFIAQFFFSFCFYLMILVVTEDWKQDCQIS